MGKVVVWPNSQKRDTKRARGLRNNATPAERALWNQLSRSQLGAKFSQQMPVGPYLDGFSHELRQDHDARRDEYLSQAGYRVLRFDNLDVHENLEGGGLRDPRGAEPTRLRLGRYAAKSRSPSRLREGGIRYRALARMKSSTTGAIFARHLLPLKMP